MTYNVLGGTLSLTQLNFNLFHKYFPPHAFLHFADFILRMCFLYNYLFVSDAVD